MTNMLGETGCQSNDLALTNLIGWVINLGLHAYGACIQMSVLKVQGTETVVKI